LSSVSPIPLDEEFLTMSVRAVGRAAQMSGNTSRPREKKRKRKGRAARDAGCAQDLRTETCCFFLGAGGYLLKIVNKHMVVYVGDIGAGK